MSGQTLKEMSSSAAAGMGTAAERVRDYAQHASESVQHTAKQASESVQHTAKQAAEQVRAGYGEAERFVRNRPGESILVGLAVGLIAGVVLALSLRSR